MASGSKATFVEIVMDRRWTWSRGACHLSLQIHRLRTPLVLRHVSNVNMDILYRTVLCNTCLDLYLGLSVVYAVTLSLKLYLFRQCSKHSIFICLSTFAAMRSAY
jgi:hypothetical protein